MNRIAMCIPVFIFVCFMLLGVLPLPSALVNAAAKICTYCKKPVQTTQYFAVDGKYFCSNHFRCANCDKQIDEREYFKENGKYYDHACYVQLFAPTCAYCKKPIDGAYTTFDGKSYHDSCYTHHVALRCTYCGEMINGEYYQDYWGNNYHAAHEGKVPECAYCLRLISAASNGGEQYKDGRWICGLCSKTAVTTLDQMNQLVKEVRQALLAKGIEVPFDEADNHLVSKQELTAVTKRHEPDVQGYASYKEKKIAFGLVTTERQVDVYMLYGMPRMKATQILAHELMHLWQFRNAKRDAELSLSEGTAHYIAWLVMHDFSGDGVNFLLHNMEKDPDPVYGEGFRRVRKFAQSQNMTSFLAYMGKNKTMPAGY